MWYFLISVCQLTSYLHWQTKVATCSSRCDIFLSLSANLPHIFIGRPQQQRLFLQVWYFLISVRQLTSYLHWQTSVAVSVPPDVIFSYLCLTTYLISSLADFSSSVCSSRCDIFLSLSTSYLHWQTSVAVSVPPGVIFSYLCQLTSYLQWQTSVAASVPLGGLFSYLCLPTYLISSLADLSSSVCSSRCDIFLSLSANLPHIFIGRPQ